ncbi:MAG: polymerase sigma factor [Amycolatopsis sp.]|uniref:sigma factor-like helix-turn-helix DNA-binding protein n=1 Tax=Amycolatopsis sp. TaxID=37632 RepID=UPI002617E289|nr:sigma factor-like helix-turn-helix DNA-binding protein [Amycolatopsis sp.]MCU1687831.1 polymerase sigma factor [Amycolatopsis sp.]
MKRLALAADLKARIARLLTVLDASQRDIVTLRAENLRATEVAEMLGVTPGYVRIAHHRALAKLRTVMAGAR